MSFPIPPELVRGYLTKDIPPVPGEVRAVPEDFRVDEVPLYEPSGAGEHVYLRVEKRGITTNEAIQRLARRLRVNRRAIGHAGLKDARAVTSQTLSVHLPPGDLPNLDDDEMRVVDAKRHGNKLRTGHLLGNRFKLRVKGGAAGEADARRVLERLAQKGVANYFGLQRFGRERTTHRLGLALIREDAQAFLDLLLLGADGREGPVREDLPDAPDMPLGPDGEPLVDLRGGGGGGADRRDAPVSASAPAEAEEGEGGEDSSPPAPEPVADRPRRSRLADAREAMRRGAWKEALSILPMRFTAEHAALRALAKGKPVEQCARSVPVEWRGFYTAATQSLLFNAYLSRRLERTDRIDAGEICLLHKNGACFVTEDPATEQARADAFEISPSGPMFGSRMLRPPEGSPSRALEDAVLAALAPGLGAELSEALGAKPRGERRPLRIPLRDVDVTVDGADLVLSFFLPRGCYATTVLEELFKRPTD